MRQLLFSKTNNRGSYFNDLNKRYVDKLLSLGDRQYSGSLPMSL